jgi:hypothetical protein
MFKFSLTNLFKICYKALLSNWGVRKTMTKHIKNIIEGAGQILVLMPDVHYERPSKNGFKNDKAALKSDSLRVARDLKDTTDKYGKINYSKG